MVKQRGKSRTDPPRISGKPVVKLRGIQQRTSARRRTATASRRLPRPPLPRFGFGLSRAPTSSRVRSSAGSSPQPSSAAIAPHTASSSAGRAASTSAAPLNDSSVCPARCPRSRATTATSVHRATYCVGVRTSRAAHRATTSAIGAASTRAQRPGGHLRVGSTVFGKVPGDAGATGSCGCGRGRICGMASRAPKRDWPFHIHGFRGHATSAGGIRGKSYYVVVLALSKILKTSIKTTYCKISMVEAAGVEPASDGTPSSALHA